MQLILNEESNVADFWLKLFHVLPMLDLVEQLAPRFLLLLLIDGRRKLLLIGLRDKGAQVVSELTGDLLL